MDLKTETKNSHPYTDYEKTKEWQILEKGLSALEKNQDIIITTAKQHIIGFLVQQLLENNGGV